MFQSLTARINELNISSQMAELERKAVVQYAALASITLLAIFIRFFKLGAWGFWIDEVYEIQYAQEAVRNFSLPVRVSLPLIGLVLNALGVSEWSARLVPALTGVVSIPVLYFPTRKLFGTPAALLAVLLLAISPWHLLWSQNARFYTFLLLFYALSQFFFFFWLESGRLWHIIFSGVFLLLAVLERSMAIILAPVAALYLAALLFLPLGKPAGLRWKPIITLALLALAAGLVVLLTTGAIQGFFASIVGHQHNPVRVLLSVIYDVGLPLFLMALFGGCYLLLQKSRPGVFILIGAVVPLVILVLIAPFTQAFSRYVFMTLINWVILGAVATKELLTQTPKGAKVLALGVMLLLVADAFSQNVLYFGYQNGNREDFRSAYRAIAANREAEDLVIAGWPELGEYYLGQEVIENHELEGEDIVQSGERAWIVVDNRSGFSAELQSWTEQNAELKGVYDVTVAGKTLMVRLYLYDPLRSSSGGG